MLLLFASVAHAEEEAEARRYGQHFNGSFFDFSPRVGLQSSTASDYNGWSWDVGVRQALVMSLLDTRVSYGEERWSAADNAGIVSRSLQVHTAFHPLYMALLLSNWLGYVLSSWHLELGLGGHLSHARDLSVTDPGFRFSVGSGLDVPITDPDRGVSVWLNALYRYNWIDFDTSRDTEINLHHHAGWLGLSLRFNGLLL